MEATAFSHELKRRGVDFIDVSSGGNSPLQQIDVGPGYQTGFASDIRRETGLPTMAVGQITEPKQAEAILRSGQADMISLARGMLYNPRWAWHAAEELDAEVAYAPQYMRTNRALRGLPIQEIRQLLNNTALKTTLVKGGRFVCSSPLCS